MTASLHKLTAGDGYTYLTRQVAVTDSTERGRTSLADYYTEKGERPGRWVGAGLTGLTTVAVGDRVSEAQMRALFGEGRHPDADQLQQDAIAAGISVTNALKATQLGRVYPQTAGEPTPFLIQTQRRYQEYNAAHGQRLNSPVPDEIRAQIRTQVARATFEQMHGRAPLDEQELTSHVTRQSRRPAQAVAGFDVTFTPVKSVSSLWAVAPRDVAEQIEAAHEAAVDHALAWLEQQVAHTRRGAQGVRQVEVRGILATAFTHRDSRNGDPNLHTHVAIANKVQDLTDGTWLSLDGAALYRAMVTISEHYNSHLEAELVGRLGVGFDAEAPRPDRRPIREVVGVPVALMEAWSSRRVQIEAETDRLADTFAAEHGRAPSTVEMIQLAQQANLATRQAKHEPRSLADQRATWRAQAVAVLGTEDAVDALTWAVCQLDAHRATDAQTLDEDTLNAAAMAVVETVSRARARWQPTHVMAEAYRRLRTLNLPGEAIDPAVAEVTARVVAGAVPLTRVDEVGVPGPLRRSDGSSVYEPRHARLYTTTAVLQAEERIVGYALQRDGRTVDETMLALACLEAEANGRALNPGQAELVKTLGMSGRRVQLAIAPAGSGKTTAMATLARAWTDSGGTVIGLAPSAVAAEELRAAVPDGTVDTLAQLAYALVPGGSGQRIPLPGWAARIDETSLVVVDEAGMAGTAELGTVIDFVVGRGGSVRLIGDDRQLAAVGAGGVLRDIQQAAGAATLAELMRFADPAEAAATLAVRDGDPAAVGFYLDRGRLHDAGDPTETIVDAWADDLAAGRTPVMITGTRQAAGILNEKARARRVADGLVDPAGQCVYLRHGLPAAVGDHVVTRRNDRRNRLSGTDFVKNGDRWTVIAVSDGGAVRVRHQRSGKLTWLRADYVGEHVDHAYAVTVHSAQGSTVDVAHVLVDGSEDRQMLYVAVSRGRLGNHLYLRTGGDGDPHTVIRPEVIRPLTGAEVLTGILHRDGAEESASTTRRLAASPQQQLHQHALRYMDGIHAAAEDLAGPAQLQRLEEQAETLVPGVTGCGGWPPLRMMLAMVAVGGGDPIAELQRVRDGRSLPDVVDVAAVLGWRLEACGLFTGQGPLPWLIGVPPPLVDHPRWGPYLQARAELIGHHAAIVRNQATLTTDPPRWATTIQHDKQLWCDLAVWRAGINLPDTDLLPAGTRLGLSRERSYQQQLEQRIDALAGPRILLPEDVLRLLADRDPQVQQDPFWPVLAGRLSAAHQQGVDVGQLLTTAFDQGRLPEERPAAALWFRLAGELRLISAKPDPDIRLRPGWTDHLLGRLPDPVAPRVLTSPDWPELVAAVADTITRTGESAEVLLDQAMAGINLADVTAGGVPADAVPVLLIWGLTELATPPPDIDDVLPPDPEDLDGSRPHDLDDLHPAVATVLTQPAPAEFVVEEPGLDEPPAGEGTEPTADDDLPAGTPPARLVELTTAAAVWWAQQYTGSPAAAYIAGRLGDDLSSHDRVTVGYAPAGWTDLVDHLHTTGATAAELVDAGLARWSRRGSLIDVMRGRVVFGIRDRAGDLVGFTGRTVPSDTTGPKWLNTPTTAIFTKGELLFGHAEHQDLLAGGATPVRVEGVMDALAVTLASNGEAVGLAPLGTALTAAQADLLAQAAPQSLVLHATDTDRAGWNAAAKDYWLLTARGVDVRRLILTDGLQTFHDPADAYHTNPAGLSAALAATTVAPPLAGHLIADLISSNTDVLHTGHIHAVVGVARTLGRIIAATPPDQRADLVTAAAAMLADTTSDHPDRYLELVTTTTDEAAQSWTEQPPPTLQDRLRATAATVEAARRHTTAGPEVAAVGAHHDRRRSEDYNSEPDPEHEISP